MLKKTFFMVMTIIAVLLFSNAAFAGSDKVTVALPSFNIQLNGIKIDNTSSQYPLIVYKDITYFPMTFYVTRFMGLETVWSPASGLKIAKTGVVAEYRGYETDLKNARTGQASIPTFPISLNGDPIDNSLEEYPLLVFRDITYFPLTWKFAVEKFGWSYDFNQSTGLAIKSQNTAVEKLNLPYEKGADSPQIMDGYYYYVAEIEGKGYVYRAPVENPNNASKVIELDEGLTPYNPHVSIFKLNDAVYISNYVGGATMGSYRYYRVNTEGVAERVVSGKIFIALSGADLVVLSNFVPPITGNLYYRKSGGADQASLGDPAYLYGWVRLGDGGYSFNSKMEIRDGWVFLTAVQNADNNDQNHIYKINLDSNEMRLVSDIPASGFSLAGNKIYFLNSKDGRLYSKGLEGEQEEMLVDAAVADYAIDEDAVYYIAKDSRELFRQNNTGATEALLPGKRVASMQIMNGYVICKLDNNEAYGLVVFGQKGNEIFKTSDRVVNASMEGNLLVYRTYESQNNYMVRLPMQ